jgi:protein ImuB
METRRLGCLSIPAFRIQVHRRDEGLEPTVPLMLVTRQARRQVVIAASDEALNDGVRPGMPLTQAEIACPRALVREEDPGRYAAAGQTLLVQLQALAPVVEAVRLGLYYLGMKGMRWLYEDEHAMLEAVVATMCLSGLTASAGAAGTRFTALAAALVAGPGKVRQVRSGDEPHFLAPLPLSLLPDPGDLLERLHLLGITTLGELAALPPRSVERRYGPEGVRLYRLARADDASHIDPTPAPTARRRTALLEEPASSAEGLLFVLSPLVDRLLDELAHEGRACAALDVTLRLERGDPIEVPVMMGSPVTQAKPVIDLLRLKLPKVVLTAGVVEVRIEATRVTEPSAPQGDLFRRVGSPSGMAVTLARLTDALGPDAVVVSALADGYRPDQAYTLQPVQEGAPGLLAAAAGELPGGRPRRGGAKADGSADAGDEAAPGPDESRVPPGFSRIDPPLPLEVKADDDGPHALVIQAHRRQVAHCAGPFRYNGQWWKKDYDRVYYQLTLADGVELLVFLERGTGTWYLEGVYDA